MPRLDLKFIAQKRKFRAGPATLSEFRHFAIAKFRAYNFAISPLRNSGPIISPFRHCEIQSWNFAISPLRNSELEFRNFAMLKFETPNFIGFHVKVSQI
jgi:hypothetical protein